MLVGLSNLNGQRCVSFVECTIGIKSEDEQQG